MPKFSQLTDRITIVTVQAPTSTGAGTSTTSGVDLNGFTACGLWVVLGTMAAGATIDVKAQSSATSGGTYADITDGAIVQLTQAGGSAGDNKKIFVPLVQGQNFVRAHITVGTAASTVGVNILKDLDART